MSAFPLMSDTAKALKRTRITRQKEKSSPLKDGGGTVEETARQLAAAFLIQNTNAVLIGTDIVFFGPQNTIVPLSRLLYAPTPSPAARTFNTAPTAQTTTPPKRRVKIAEVKTLSRLSLPQPKKIHLVPKPVERGHESTKLKHGPSCECFACRDNRKWEQRFEERYGASMRAYYGPR